MSRPAARVAAGVAALAARAVPPGGGAAGWPGTLSAAELTDLAAARLAPHGVGPGTAAEAHANRWRPGSRAGGDSRAGPVPPLPEALASHVADPRRGAEPGGAPAEVASRFGDGGFRRRAVARAVGSWPPDGWTYGQGFAWVPGRMAAAVPAGEVTHAACHGPDRGPGMAPVAAGRPSRDGARGPGRGSP